MERSRRQWVVWMAGGLGLLVLVSAAVVGLDSLLERWHLLRLESPDEEVRADAARRLGELRSARAVPRLLDLSLAVRNVPGRTFVLEVGPGFYYFDEGPNPYREALLAVGDRGVPTLVDAARGDDGRASDAFAILIALPALPGTAAPVLVERMVKDESLGGPVATALGKLGPAGVAAALREPRARFIHGKVVREALRLRPEAFLEVLEVLRKEPWDLESLLGLADEIARAGKRFLPALSRAVEDENPRVALLAAWAVLEAAGSAAPPDGALAARASLPVAVLARHLSHEDPGIRACTAKLLGRLGPTALPVLPELLPLLSQEEPETLMAAMRALAALGAGAVRPLLTALSNMGSREAEARTRDHALTVLVSLGAEDGAAVETLLEGLGDGDPRVPSACASALGGVGALRALGPRLDRAVAALQEAAGRPQVIVRRAALQALDAISLGQATPVGQKTTAFSPREE